MRAFHTNRREINLVALNEIRRQTGMNFPIALHFSKLIQATGGCAAPILCLALPTRAGKILYALGNVLS